MCDALGELGDGKIEYRMDDDGVAPFILNTIAIHACNDGFFLSGAEVRVCEDTNRLFGVWNGTVPTCEGK